MSSAGDVHGSAAPLGAEAVDGRILVQLARLALRSPTDDVVMVVHRQAYQLRRRSPRTAAALTELLTGIAVPSPLRHMDAGMRGAGHAAAGGCQ